MYPVKKPLAEALASLDQLLAECRLRTEIIPNQRSHSIHSFHEAKNAHGLRVGVSIERYGPSERIYFEVRYQGPYAVWVDVPPAELQRPIEHLTASYVRPATVRLAKWLRE